MSETPAEVQLLTTISRGVYLTYSIYAAASLGVTDTLRNGPRTAEEIAQEVGAHAPSLYRVLRTLASEGIFAEDDAGRFDLTDQGRLLGSGPESLRAFAVIMGESWHHQAWGSFLHGLRTGDNIWAHAHGQTFFEYFAAHPDRAKMFGEMMSELSSIEAAGVVAAYPFTGVGTVADIGGGYGLLLSTVLSRHPNMRGILFELPHVTPRAEKFLSGDIAARTEIVSGDMFESVPAGVDAYLLKNILHDWDDDRAIAILSQVRRAMKPDAKVLVLQDVITPGNTPSYGKLLDIMMILIGGRERTRPEYERLFERAGLRVNAVIDTPAPIHVVEGVMLP
ncbi:methyltransferase [Solwaraspora sp. WMMB335]|uniref:methyltransferase n=1 Tax=Solwaraspora sp. WMMB335 TaxID=3404118 RepID=UPI003B927D6D